MISSNPVTVKGQYGFFHYGECAGQASKGKYNFQIFFITNIVSLNQNILFKENPC